MERQRTFESVVRALRRVNHQGSLFGQTIAIRLGLSESDVEALQMLMDTGASTAGRLAELMGLTTGAVTRMVDRLEQAGYVRRVDDPADRRRVVVELVPDRAAQVRELIDAVAGAAAREIGRYSPEQLDTINDFLERMAETTRTERERLREQVTSSTPLEGEHAAPVGGLREARLVFRSGAAELTLRGDATIDELYRARFEGSVPQVRLRDGVVSVQYRGGLMFDWRKRKADIALNPAVGWAIELQGGLAELRGRLEDVDLRSADITGGASKIDIVLGQPGGIVPLKVIGGVSDVRIRRPAGAAVRLVIAGGAGKVELDGQRIGGTAGATLESAGAANATDRFDVSVIGGASKVIVEPSKG
jgi:DNA-binding MarR family transcriptional regulator